MAITPDPSSTGRVFFLDPSLGVSAGHHSVVAANYRTLLARLGIDPIFIGNRRAKPTEIAELRHFIGLFQHRADDAFRISKHGQRWMGNPALLRVAQTARRAFRQAIKTPKPRAARSLSADKARAALASLGVAAALDALALRFALNKNDHVVALAGDPALLAAFHERSAFWLNACGPRLHIVSMYPERDTFGPAMREGLFATYRDVFASACSPLAYAETAAHAEWLSSTLDIAVTQIVTPTRLIGAKPPPESDQLVVVALGGARADKGFQILPEIVRAVSATRPLCFRIQGAAGQVDLRRAEAALRDLPAVTILDNRLSQTVYDVEIEKAHIVLLPYDSAIFSLRGSGVFNDAMVAGRPIVCTEGSTLAQSLAGNGLAGSGVEGLSRALVRLAEAYPSYLEAARRMSQQRLEAITNSLLIQRLR